VRRSVRLERRTSSSQDDKVERTYGRLSCEQEETVIPEFDCRARIDALNELVTTAPTTHNNSEAITVLVGPPGSGVEETLLGWAEGEQDDILQQPEPEHLLQAYDVDIPDGDDSRPLVIPALHNCYLRHPAGLRALRKLLERLRGIRNTRRILLGCDSWAWAYLRRSAQVDAMLSRPFSLAPLTGKSLRDCLFELCGGEDPCPLEFRFADDDSPVFCAHAKERDPPKDEKNGHHALFDHLASISRGIPDVAIELWKSGLRTVQDTDDTLNDEAQRSDVDGSSTIIWVQEFSASELPVVPADVSRLDAIVLHSLLVHAGLSENILHRLLPCFDEARVTRSLFALRDLTLVDQVNGFWEVRHLAYPNVRGFLAGECFLVDDF
jgi:hypothetical protein